MSNAWTLEIDDDFRFAVRSHQIALPLPEWFIKDAEGVGWFIKGGDMTCLANDNFSHEILTSE